jgi:hypothetical protein
MLEMSICCVLEESRKGSSGMHSICALSSRMFSHILKSLETTSSNDNSASELSLICEELKNFMINYQSTDAD